MKLPRFLPVKVRLRIGRSLYNAHVYPKWRGTANRWRRASVSNPSYLPGTYLLLLSP